MSALFSLAEELKFSLLPPQSVVLVVLQKIVGVTPKSNEMVKGTAPVHSKNSHGPRNEVPDRFGENRTFSKNRQRRPVLYLFNCLYCSYLIAIIIENM